MTTLKPLCGVSGKLWSVYPITEEMIRDELPGMIAHGAYMRRFVTEHIDLKTAILVAGMKRIQGMDSG